MAPSGSSPSRSRGVLTPIAGISSRTGFEVVPGAVTRSGSPPTSNPEGRGGVPGASKLPGGSGADGDNGRSWVSIAPAGGGPAGPPAQPVRASPRAATAGRRRDPEGVGMAQARPRRRPATPAATSATTPAARRGTGAVGAREEGAVPPAPVRMPPAGAVSEPAASLKAYSSRGAPAPPTSATDVTEPGSTATVPLTSTPSPPERRTSTR